MINISVCIITKNEAQYLDKCLSGLSKYPFEIVVTDTGSTDNSIEVAKKYTNNISTYEWCDDFSAARNYSVSKAGNDYVLIVDTDEFVKDVDIKEFDRLIKLNPGAVGRTEIININTRNGESDASHERVSRFYDRRLFEFKGSVHEQIVAKNGEPHSTYDIPVAFEHVGYNGNDEEREKKALRNIELLKSELEKQYDPYYLYQLGKSYYMMGKYAEAVGAFSQAASFDLDTKLEYVIDMITTYGYSMLNAGMTKEALMFENIYDEFSGTAEFVFMMGFVYMNNAVFDRAVEEFEKASKFQQCMVEGVNSYKAYYNIGVIYECLGDKENALKYYRRCGNYDKAKLRIKAMM